MTPPTGPMDMARAYRVMHTALVAGLVLLGATLLFVLRAFGVGVPRVPVAGLPLLVVSIILIGLGGTLLRGRVAQRRADESPADYWTNRENAARILVLWCVIEGSALIAWVDYLLTGLIVPVVVAVIATVLLALYRPGQLEGAA